MGFDVFSPAPRCRPWANRRTRGLRRRCWAWRAAVWSWPYRVSRYAAPTALPRMVLYLYLFTARGFMSSAQFDKHWIGEPPERDVFVIGLNETVKSSLLRETCAQLAPVYAIKFHHHPKTKTFLGAATVAFTHASHGKKAVGELDGKIVGGCYLRAEVDDRG